MSFSILPYELKLQVFLILAADGDIFALSSLALTSKSSLDIYNQNRKKLCSHALPIHFDSVVKPYGKLAALLQCLNHIPENESSNQSGSFEDFLTSINIDTKNVSANDLGEMAATHTRLENLVSDELNLSYGPIKAILPVFYVRFIINPRNFESHRRPYNIEISTILEKYPAERTLLLEYIDRNIGLGPLMPESDCKSGLYSNILSWVEMTDRYLQGYMRLCLEAARHRKAFKDAIPKKWKSVHCRVAAFLLASRGTVSEVESIITACIDKRNKANSSSMRRMKAVLKNLAPVVNRICNGGCPELFKRIIFLDAVPATVSYQASSKGKGAGKNWLKKKACSFTKCLKRTI